MLDLGHLPQNISLQLIYDEMDQCLQVHICEKKIPLVLVGAIHHDKESTLSKKCWSFKLAGETLETQSTHKSEGPACSDATILTDPTLLCAWQTQKRSRVVFSDEPFPCFGTTRSRSVRQASHAMLTILVLEVGDDPQRRKRIVGFPRLKSVCPKMFGSSSWASYQQHDKSIVALPLEKIFHIGKTTNIRPYVSPSFLGPMCPLVTHRMKPTIRQRCNCAQTCVMMKHTTLLPMTRLMLTFLCHNQSFTWWLVPSSIYSSCSICFSKAHPWPCNNFLRYLSCILTQSLHCVSKFAPNYCYVLATRGVKKAALFEVLNVHFLRPYFLTDVPLQPSLRLSSVLSLHAGGRIVSACISLKRKAETSPLMSTTSFAIQHLQHTRLVKSPSHLRHGRAPFKPTRCSLTPLWCHLVHLFGDNK